MKGWWVAGLAIALTGCLGEPELKEGAPDAGRRLDGALDAAGADQGLDLAPPADMAPDATVDGEAPDASTPTDQGADAAPDAGGCAPGEAQPCGSDVGACTPGMQFCQQDGQWSACFDAVTPSPETCDGVDNDCDGEVDEDSAESCGSDVGACLPGARLCIAGALGPCEGAVLPQPETCNGVDDNCDGVVDEQLTRACGTNQGVCTPGVERCEGGAWGACDAAVLPDQQPEACDGEGLDEDCDGVANEGCACVEGERRACGSDQGTCRAGAQTCAGGVWGECEGAVGAMPEVCDGQDNDCNGTVDDPPSVGDPCAVGVGACQAEGRLACVEPGAAPRCDADAGVPEAEVCNGLDDDCDGTVDDGIAAVTARQVIGGAGRAALPQPAIAPIEGGYAVLWLAVPSRLLDGDDVGVRFGTFDPRGRPLSDPVWVQAPNADNQPTAVALISAEGELVYALGQDTLGGPDLVLGTLSAEGTPGRARTRLTVDHAPERLDLATGDGRLMLVWDEPDAQAPRAYFHQTDALGGQARGRRLAGEAIARAPSVAWDGAAFAVAYTFLEDNRSVVALTRLGPRDDALGTQNVAVDAAMARVRWVPTLDAYALVWSTTGRTRDLVFALVGADGERLAQAPVVEDAAPRWPDLAIRPGVGRGGPRSVAVVWQAGDDALGALHARMMVPALGDWRAAGRPAQLEQGGASAPRLVWHPAAGQFAAVHAKPARIRAETLLHVGPMGCETAE